MSTSLQRYLALYRHLETKLEVVLEWGEHEGYELVSEPQRVTFKPRIPDKIREAVMALDDKMRKLQDEWQHLQQERVKWLKGEQS